VQTEFSTMLRPISSTFWQLGVLALLSLWIYWSTLSHLLGQWRHDPDFSFGFVVPLFSAFLVWENRHRLARIPSEPAWSGLVMLGLGLALLIVGQMGAELFLARFSLLLVLAGVIVLFYGWNMFRALLFPWAFLVLMIPIPNIVLNQVTFPLQLLASKVGAGVLSFPLFGKPLVPVLREGNIMHLPNMDLEVAEACSGIRSLMSLMALAIIYGYLMEKRVWVRWLLAAAAVPIAVLANSVRIIGTGLIAQYWDRTKAEGYYHESWGWIVFVVSLLLLYAVHNLISLWLPGRDGGGRAEKLHPAEPRGADR
jgi:exosortase